MIATKSFKIYLHEELEIHLIHGYIPYLNNVSMSNGFSRSDQDLYLQGADILSLYRMQEVLKICTLGVRFCPPLDHALPSHNYSCTAACYESISRAAERRRFLGAIPPRSLAPQLGPRRGASS